MANLYAFGFEGGVVPAGVTRTRGAMRPTVGRRVTDQLTKWGLVASSTVQEQAEVSLALGSALSKIGGSYYFRADNISYVTPLVLVDFGAVTISLTSATNLRVNDGTSDTDYTVTAVTTGWNLLQFNIDLAATTNAITTNFNLEGVQSITMGAAITGTDTALILRSIKGYNSTLEDIRIETAVANGACPTSIECLKSTVQGAFKNQWQVNGTPSGASTGLNIRGLCYCHSTNLFYAINEAGAIYKINPLTLTSTLILTVDSAYGHCAMVYHQALNRIYFIGTVTDSDLAYLDPVSETVTYADATVYYTYSTHASGAYYEPLSGNAYIVTMTNASNTTDSVAVHKIDVSGAYTSYVHSGTHNPRAPLTRHFNVCYSRTEDAILFPMFSSKVIGRCTQALVFTVSNSDGANTITDINDAGGYWGSFFLVASDDGTSRVRTYNAGVVARYQASVATNAGITGKGLVYHPYLGVLLYQITGAVGDLYQCVKGNANFVKVATNALPANASVYLLNQINPITGGLLYIYNNALSECHLLTNLNVSSLQIKDDKYIQSATNNNEMNLLPSAVIPNNVAILKMNACMKNAFGTGSVSLAGATRTVVGAGADYCGSVDALPVPEVLYDFREAVTTTANGWANQGSGGGTLSSTLLIKLNSAFLGIEGGRNYVEFSQAAFSAPNPANSVGTGDFCLVLAGEVFRDNYTDTVAHSWTLGTDVLWFNRFGGSLKIRLGGNLICTVSLQIGYNVIKIGRLSGVFYVLINSAQVYTQTFADSITFSGTILSTAGTTGGFMHISAIMFSSYYPTDPNPIAGLNRREIVVTKTA
jgi:hypothetical protein